MRTTLGVCAVCCFTIPVAVAAALVRPSDIVLLSSYDGKPRTFSAQSYLGVEDVSASVTVTGAMEGRQTQDLKMKGSVHADVMEGGEWLASVDARAVVYQQKLYVLLERMAVRDGEDTNDMLNVIGQWYVMPIEWQDWQQAENRKDFLRGLTVQLEEMGVRASEQDLERFITMVIDAVYTVEHVQYVGGHAYSLRLHPRFLHNTIGIILQFLAEHGEENIQLFVREMQQGLAASPSIVEEVESQLRDAANLHLKVDTNTANEFVFGKYYASLHLPEENVYFALQGNVQRQMMPVYLDVPRNALPLNETEMMEVPGQYLDMLVSSIGDMIQECEWMWGPGTDECNGEELSPLFEQETQSLPLPRSRTGETGSQGNRSTLGCAYQPGTKEYVRMQREGVCPTVHWRHAGPKKK